MIHAQNSTAGNSLLQRLNFEGVYPSPYNFIDLPQIKLDEFVIHDSTLREGEQTPNVHYTIEDKVCIAKKLDEIGIKRIETGFPVASEKQFNSIKAITRLNLDTQITGFARAKKRDIDAAAMSGVDSIIVTFSISEFHRKIKFKGMSKETYLAKLHDAISYAESKGMLTIYSAEDTSREGDINFLKEAYRVAEDAGAKRARIIDTLGCLIPSGVTSLVTAIREAVDIPLEVHFHNDVGMALINSMTALQAGASTISTCVNGLGERAGITSTDEVVALLYLFFGIDYYDLGKMTELSHLVEKITGIPLHPQKPVTGNNVLIHSSGIHQHGVMNDPLSYEFYPSGLFGKNRGIELNELSGRHGVTLVARNELGMDLHEETAIQVLALIKNSYTDGSRRSSYTPEELRSLIQRVTGA